MISAISMSTDNKLVSSYASPNIVDSASQAWLEVCSVAESLSKSPHSTFRRFFPTDFPACHAPINAAIAERHKQQSPNPFKKNQFKTGGYVFFPGKSTVGENSTIIIPLHIDGNVSIEGLRLDSGSYYQISRQCSIEVAEGAKLVGLIIDSD